MLHVQTITELAIGRAERGIFTRRQAAFWVDNCGARLNALLKRAVGSQEVERIHRGLYVLNNRYLQRPIDPLELAQRIHGPSYISLETALSYHGWIPEAVHAITSVSLARSRTFGTPLGLFSYTRVPQLEFFAGVCRISGETGGSFLLATPLKALADYVYTHRCHWTSAAPVVESLRVDEEFLSGLTAEMFDALLPLYQADGVHRFLLGLRKDLKR
jgi:hypothetical protein